MCPGGDDGIGSGEVLPGWARVCSPPALRGLVIDKGLVYAPDHGIIAFTVPSMEAFIGRQAE